MKNGVTIVMILLALTQAVIAADIWYQDNNVGQGGGLPSDFKAHFQEPETWATARAELAVYFIRAGSLRRGENGVDDAFLREHLIPVLRQAEIPIALDVQGATWLSERGDAALQAEIALVRRLRGLGADVAVLSLQSVLSKAWKPDGSRQDYPMASRYEDVRRYMAAMQAEFPGIRIGITDAMPSHAKDYATAYRGLAAHLKAHGLSLDHVFLDLPQEIPAEKLRASPGRASYRSSAWSAMKLAAASVWSARVAPPATPRTPPSTPPLSPACATTTPSADDPTSTSS